MEKARERLAAAEELLAKSLFGDSIGRSYYAVFTAARAILALVGLDSKSHAGVIAFFNRHFVKTGILPKHFSKIISDVKRGREASDYADYVEFSREEAGNQLKEAQAFVSTVEQTITAAISGKIALPFSEATS
jgi:hypothetical protein